MIRLSIIGLSIALTIFIVSGLLTTFLGDMKVWHAIGVLGFVIALAMEIIFLITLKTALA